MTGIWQLNYKHFVRTLLINIVDISHEEYIGTHENRNQILVRDISQFSIDVDISIITLRIYNYINT
jgi:hypothetical protein